MFIPFEQMKDTSRLWVYQCNRVLSAEEAEWLSNSMSTFLTSWAAHGQQLLSSCILEENIFLILAVDEASHGASGCSIDASVHELQTLQQKMGVDFFTRDTVVFKKDGALERVSLLDLKQQVADGKYMAETPVFNTLINAKEDLKKNWVVPAGNTWLKRYFKTAATLG